MLSTTEKEKMIRGELYLADDPLLLAERARAAGLLAAYNASPESDPDGRRHLLEQLLGAAGEQVYVRPPFYCDYGYNITLGRAVYFNFNCVLLDVCPITIGDRSMFGPAVQILTPLHPLDAVERAGGLEYGAPITIGADVWVGGGVLILPGVTIGDGTVIGAGAVVTRDLPAGVFAAGNPCQVIRPL